jgi:hypothetical protein
MAGSEGDRERCGVCGKDVSNSWFGRMRNGEGWVKVCSPECSIRYINSLHPADEARAQDLAAYEDRVHFYFNGELWS